MAIQSNANDVVDAGVELWSGITNMKVLAVNPTLAELNAMEVNAKTEPNYKVEFSGQAYNKVVFWIGNNDTKVKAEILMASEVRTSKTGKFQWINKFGQSCWADAEPAYDWFKSDGQHKCLIGEETLIKFMIAWANVLKGGEVSLDTMANIAAGDVTELRSYIEVLKQNEIKVLVGVKDGKYQSVYSKYFGKASINRTDYFVNELNKDFGSFNADFNADLVWATHTPTATLVTPDTTSEDKDWDFPEAPQDGSVPSPLAATADSPF
tara:strand:+ start:2440 stop:3237 length:798 start_codon:yes stop_codon:yes gene_type:complete